MTEKTPKNPRGPRPLKAGQKTHVVIRWPLGLTEQALEALAAEEGITTRNGLANYASVLLADALDEIIRAHETKLALARADALEAEIEARRKALAEAEAELARVKATSGTDQGLRKRLDEAATEIAEIEAEEEP